MGTSRGKKQEETYRKEADTARAEVKASPLEEKRNASAMQFFNDIESGKDVSEIAALKPNLNLYNAAVSDQQNDRKGTGILQLGARGANPNQAAALDTYMKYQRQQNAAGQLENAYNATYADYSGNLSPLLMQMSNQRQATKAGLAQDAYKTYLNRPKTPSIWEKLLQGGISAATAYVTGGMSAGK